MYSVDLEGSQILTWKSKDLPHEVVGKIKLLRSGYPRGGQLMNMFEQTQFWLLFGLLGHTPRCSEPASGSAGGAGGQPDSVVLRKGPWCPQAVSDLPHLRNPPGPEQTQT